MFFFNKSKKFLFVALGEIGAHITKMGNKSFCEALCFSKSSESIVGIAFFTAILSVLLSDYRSTLLAHKAWKLKFFVALTVILRESVSCLLPVTQAVFQHVFKRSLTPLLRGSSILPRPNPIHEYWIYCLILHSKGFRNSQSILSFCWSTQR